MQLIQLGKFIVNLDRLTLAEYKECADGTPTVILHFGSDGVRIFHSAEAIDVWRDLRSQVLQKKAPQLPGLGDK